MALTIMQRWQAVKTAMLSHRKNLGASYSEARSIVAIGSGQKMGGTLTFGSPDGMQVFLYDYMEQAGIPGFLAMDKGSVPVYFDKRNGYHPSASEHWECSLRQAEKVVAILATLNTGAILSAWERAEEAKI